MKIGFVGVGKMGVGMVLNLLNAGYEVDFFARRQSASVKEVLNQGAFQVRSLEELAQSTNVIILCLSNTKVTKEIICQLLPGLLAHSLIIDTTTNDVDGPKDIARILAKKDIAYVEAPVTGGVKQAREAVLGAIVGANSEESFHRVSPILNAFCKKVVHIGPVGIAARAKLISNFLALGTATLVIEVFKQARALGIEWAPLYELAQLGSGNSSGLQRIIGSAVDGDYKGYVFSVDNCLKDLTYLCELSEQTGTSSKLSPILRQIYQQATQEGLGDHMISELLDPSNSRG
ncbi:MAG TPA: 6-phosphogluconate dehydrogenase [Desulfobacteraceae bacterium]|nr:6-phosphogluconate dehydrogenase [Desulfobacteraceae bacterium]